MWLLYAISVVLCAIYCMLIMVYRIWFNKLQPFQPTYNAGQPHLFSILIPARNEGANIAHCLRSIFANDYPAHSFEVIVIDDFSTDDTKAIVTALQETHPDLQLLSLADIVGNTTLNAYKKKAIELAIGKATGDWIVTTDADCIVPVHWLKNFNDYIHQTGAVFVGAPVTFVNTHTFLSIFQCLDFMSLQGITAAAVSARFHSMCNGANLAYSKEAFYTAGGFTGIDAIASGDDMLLMHKIKQCYPGRTGFIFSKESIVQTAPMPTWKSFFNQRIRWASKGGSYDDKKVFMVLAAVYLFNAALLSVFVTGIFFPVLLILGLVLLVIKTACELFFMIPVAKFFGQQSLLRWFPLMQPFHIIYTVVAGWLGLFGKYQWKGRQVK